MLRRTSFEKILSRSKKGGQSSPLQKQGNRFVTRMNADWRCEVQPAQSAEENAWLFTDEEVAETPSRVAGLSAANEDRIHARSSRFIAECATELRIPRLTTLVAATFLRRFYMLESLTDHDLPAVASACLFLACKVQETHKRLRDFMHWTVKVRTRDLPRKIEGIELFEDSPNYEDEKALMLTKEADLLRVLNFEMSVDHPFKYLIILRKYFLQIPGDEQQPEVKDRLKNSYKDVMQSSWNLINDSIGLDIHVRFDPREIATAAFFLAAQLHRVSLPNSSKDGPSWHELFSCDLHHIQVICNSILDIYASKSV